MQWKINEAAVSEAAEALGLTFPVRVRVVPNGPAGMAGKYHGIGRRGPTTEAVLVDPTHHISLSGNLSAKMASKCLWHEITHAMQNERFLPTDHNGEEEPYAIANRGLQCAFRAEMKEVRQRYGGTPSQLTMRYGEVSFEREACKVMDDAKTVLVSEVEKVDKKKDSPLLDDKGRATWRVDVFRRGEWNKATKRRDPDE